MAVRNPPQYAEMVPKRNNVGEERKHRKEQLAGAFRVFGKFGFSEGVAGHITVRDPEYPDKFWVNPFGVSFNKIKVSDLILVDHNGQIVDGKHTALNQAAFAIHSRVHAARPDVIAAAHAHSLYGKTWSSLGRLLDPLTQDSCAFFEDHALFDDYTGVVLETSEGDRIADALKDKKAVILKNHGLLTVGRNVEETAWWFICMERCCQSQIMAEMTGSKPQPIRPETARKTRDLEVGFPAAGWFQYQPIWQDIIAAHPDLLN
jgi:ribulose-5-phosphate 4-epimerase/fuculose-1-phosphate aldolase